MNSRQITSRNFLPTLKKQQPVYASEYNKLQEDVTIGVSKKLLVEPGAGAITLTPSQIIDYGVIVEDPEGSIAYTTPTAAEIVGHLKNPAIGDSFEFTIVNEATGSSSEAITLTAGTGVTIRGTATITEGTNEAVTFLAICTSVTFGAEAVTIVPKGTV